MAAPPTKQALLNLYSSTLRTSRSFSSYNFRQYFVNRTKSTFRDIQVCHLACSHSAHFLMMISIFRFAFLW